MPLIQLPTGKTIYVSVYEYYFLLSEDDVDDFFQTCIADDVGDYMENPFSNRIERGKIEVEDEIPDIEDIPNLDVGI